MKFFIRDLLLVTVIVALAVGWWVERRKRIGAQLDVRAWEEVSSERVRKLRSDIGAYRRALMQEGFTFADEPLPNASAPPQD